MSATHIVNRLLEDSNEDEARDMLTSAEPSMLYYVAINNAEGYYLHSFNVQAHSPQDAEDKATKRLREIATTLKIGPKTLQGVTFETRPVTWDDAETP